MDRYEYLKTITFEMVKSKLPKREPEMHKGDFGKLLCVCGSKVMSGAAYFCTESALRCGVGLVRVAIPESIYGSLSSKISECTYVICDDDENGNIDKSSVDIILKTAEKCSAVAVGCGMGWNENTKFIVNNLAESCDKPMVIDADGINVISENIDILKKAKNKIVLTPHAKEAERLLNVDCGEINSNKRIYAQKLADDYGVVAVMKGHNTVVADKKEKAFLNLTGSSGMAKGGSGDVLTGIIGSFLAQGMEPLDAALCGVYVHGKSGDICQKKYSATAMLPRNIIEELSSVFLLFENGVN
ncbi:MAG: NAD(P)H-hydrate dehydratase [Clostridia bacterium]|nr:NAD(P)H-hydrate dehydratase [Clostridia bacterium]MBR2735504.1 NAD(P)H-hydrate dehydratase [Clostridia bacterium]